MTNKKLQIKTFLPKSSPKTTIEEEEKLQQLLGRIDQGLKMVQRS